MLVADDAIDYDIDGSLFSHYKLEAGRYVYDQADALSQAQEAKYRDIWAHYESLVSTTEETSSTSTDTTKAKTLQKKSDKRLTKKSNGQTLTVDEQAEEDAYDGFLDWADNNHDLADSGADTVELLTTVDDVNNFDPETDINWTTYVWP